MSSTSNKHYTYRRSNCHAVSAVSAVYHYRLWAAPIRSPLVNSRSGLMAFALFCHAANAPLTVRRRRTADRVLRRNHQNL